MDPSVVETLMRMEHMQHNYLTLEGVRFVIMKPSTFDAILQAANGTVSKPELRENPDGCQPQPTSSK